MEQLGGALASNAVPGLKVYLRGELGAGKTTLARGFLRQLGYRDKVKSPTYTLVESYDLQQVILHHFDLYRLRDPLELEAIGLRDYFDGAAICLLEWPQHGAPLLAPPDILIDISINKLRRDVILNACSERGQALLAQL